MNEAGDTLWTPAVDLNRHKEFLSLQLRSAITIGTEEPARARSQSIPCLGILVQLGKFAHEDQIVRRGHKPQRQRLMKGTTVRRTRLYRLHLSSIFSMTSSIVELPMTGVRRMILARGGVGPGSDV